MPIKFVSHIFKPRNIRVLILILVVVTLTIALYQLFLSNIFQAGNPKIFTPQDNSKLVKDTEIYQNGDEGLGHPPPEETMEDFKVKSERRKHHRIPSYNRNFASAILQYEKERENARCLKTQSFKPDIDVHEIYPHLEFDADWIRSKEYWNSFFEQRYKAIKDEKTTPTLKVFVIPHSHNDPGWLKTFEDYYTSQTRHVLDNAVEKLTEYKNMTFLWSEISFLSKWWHEAHPRKRQLLKNLVQEGRLEIVTGGWVMTDEATVNLYSMIDQLVEGHQWVKSHLNVEPKASWSVDPFGHGSTFPYILKIAGINGMVIQRIHYGWKKWLMVNQSSDFHWVQRWDFHNKHSISCHNAPFDIYSIKHSCGPHPQICLNFDFKSIAGEYSENSMIMQPITSQNVKEKAELMLEQYGKTASLFPHNMAMISMGDDFRFTKTIEWDQQYTNYVKLFNYINSRKDIYNAEVKFGTISDYFNALEQSGYSFPTFSGDFHVYSDIFSEGRPAYWSGYYGTRPFWKKFYRETENNLRGAEIVYTFANALAHQRQLNHSVQVLMHGYEDLTIARRWLALFAHHDASTGTSKAHTMDDYGDKLLEAYKLSKKIQMSAIETVLYGKADVGKLATDYEIDGFGELPRQIPLSFDNPSGIKQVVLYNSLGRQRYQIVTLVVGTPHVEVVGPSGEFIQAQLNPILDTKEQSMVLSSDLFELSFIANLAPLSVSLYQVRKSSPQGQHNAILASVYCKSCKSAQRLFEVNELQKGDIQLNNGKIKVLFDRSSGLLLSITRIKEKVTSKTEMKFGSYASTYFKSGAYLLKPDITQETQIPFPTAKPKFIIISGPISSELSVFHSPILLSNKILHVGDNRMLDALYIQNQLDVGEHGGEVYMRLDTDLKSVAKAQGTNDVDDDTGFASQPTFYTDEAGYIVEKRVKVSNIKYEGNTYPVNTMVYVQDETKKLRFSVLVDRSHGFNSMESGRLETLVERRTMYDDSRGMGEGVTDNRPTVSNYILLLEKLGPIDKVRHAERDFRSSQPTLDAYFHSQELSYPAFTFVVNGYAQHGSHSAPRVDSSGDMEVYPFLTQELPCDSHLINLRTIADNSFDPSVNFPSGKALLILQKLGYSCAATDEKPGCGNPNPLNLFYPDTSFNGIQFKSIAYSNLAGVDTPKDRKSLTKLHDIVSESFEITSAVVTFN